MVDTSKAFKVGQRVSVEWTKQAYKGKIIQVSSRYNKYKVAYDDGDIEWEKADNISLLSDQEEEDQTTGRRKRKTSRYISHQEEVNSRRRKKAKLASETQARRGGNSVSAQTLEQHLDSLPLPLKCKPVGPRSADAANADKLLFSTQQLITQMLFNRKVRDVSKAKLSTTDDATTQMALMTLEAVLSDFGQSVAASVVDQVFQSLTQGSAADAVRACKLWEIESKKPKSPAGGDSDEDTDTDNDTETEDIGYTPARSFKTPRQRGSSGKKSKQKHNQEGSVPGAVLRSSPEVAQLVLRLVTTFAENFPQEKFPGQWSVRSFEQVEAACQAVVTLQACIVYSNFTLLPHHLAKLSNWLYCANLALDWVIRSLQSCQEEGKYSSSILNVLCGVSEPQPVSICIERILNYVAASYRLVQRAPPDKLNLVHSSLDKLCWLLKVVGHALANEIASSGKYSAREMERGKSLLGFVRQPPISGTLCRELGLSFARTELEDYGAVLHKTDLLKTKWNIFKNKRGKTKSTDTLFQPLPSFITTNKILEALESITILVLALVGAEKVDVPATVAIPAAAEPSPANNSVEVSEQDLVVVEDDSVESPEVVDVDGSPSHSNSVAEDDVASSADGRTTMFGDNSSRDASDTQSILVKHKIIARPRSLSSGKMWESPYKKKLDSIKFVLRRLSSVPCSKKCPQLIRLADGAQVTLGRASVCDYRLLSKDKSQTQTISRKHATLFVTKVEGKGFVCQILDNNSSNGVFVNYIRIHPGKRVDLKPEDIVVFGGGGKTAIGSHKRFKSEFRYCLELPIPV